MVPQKKQQLIQCRSAFYKKFRSRCTCSAVTCIHIPFPFSAYSKMKLNKDRRDSQPLPPASLWLSCSQTQLWDYNKSVGPPRLQGDVRHQETSSTNDGIVIWTTASGGCSVIIRRLYLNKYANSDFLYFWVVSILEKI